MMVIFLNNDVLKSPQTPFKIWIKRVAGSSTIKLGKNAWKIIFVTYNGLITKLYEHFKKETTDSEPLWFLLSNFS